MVARGADGLSLRVGEVPTVLSTGQRVPVKDTPLTEAEWMLLVREVAGAELAARVDRREDCEFAYRDYAFRIRFDADQPECDVRRTSAAPHSDGMELDGDMNEIRGGAPPPRHRADAPSGAGQGPMPLRPPVAGVAPGQAASAAGAPAPVDAAPPWLRLARAHGKRIALGALAAALLLGAVLWWTRPVSLPELVMKGPEGQSAGFVDMRQGKDHLLLVFLIPGCQVSLFSLSTLKDLFARFSGKVSFVGLLFGTEAEAVEYQEQNGVPFAVYGLKDARDPFALQEILKKVGVSGWSGPGIYGGTVVLVDRRNHVRLRLEKEEVRELPARLAAATK